MVGLTQGDREALLRAAASAPSAHQTRPWRFQFREWVVEVHRDRGRELPAEHLDRRTLFLSLGAAIFSLRVEAAARGYGSQVRHLMDQRRPDLVAAVELDVSRSGRLALLAPYLTHRRSNRAAFSDERLPGQVRTELALSARIDGAALRWLDRPAAGLEPASQMAVLATRYDGPVEWLRAGQALERVLLEATSHGLVTSLANQLIEHEDLRHQVNDPLDPWRRPQALIRFGYGPPVSPTP
jgi:nitroreductase